MENRFPCELRGRSRIGRFQASQSRNVPGELEDSAVIDVVEHGVGLDELVNMFAALASRNIYVA